MVTMASATALSFDPKNQLPIEGNHSTIVKFGHQTQDSYQNVVRLLKDVVSTRANAAIQPSGCSVHDT